MSTSQGYEFRSKPLGELYSKWRGAGREESRAEGRQQMAAEAIIKVLRGRGLAPSTVEEELILRTTDLTLLDFWLDHAFQVASAAELLQARPPVE